MCRLVEVRKKRDIETSRPNLAQDRHYPNQIRLEKGYLESLGSDQDIRLKHIRVISINRADKRLSSIFEKGINRRTNILIKLLNET
jgi:hypothetical protein